MDQQTTQPEARSAVELTRLSIDDDNFAMAVVETGGNLKEAYIAVFGEDQYAAAKARLMIARPEIVARMAQLRDSVHEADLISVESHLIQLAEIRDISIKMGAVKVALHAEENRGKVAGYYKGKGEGSDTNKTPHLHTLAERLLAMTPQGRQQIEDVESRQVLG
jgi:hypothetical protein